MVFAKNVALLFSAETALGHGSVSYPPSRNYACSRPGEEIYTEDRFKTMRKNKELCTDPVRYTWNDFGDQTVNSRHKEVIPSGHICSAGLVDKYGAADKAPATLWEPTTITPSAGTYEFKYHATRNHKTAYIKFFATRPKWNADSNIPLRWEDLETEPFCQWTDPKQDPTQWWNFNSQLPETFKCPAIKGRKENERIMIVSIWQRIDSPEAFYSCSDVILASK